MSGKPQVFFPTAVSRGYMYAERVLCCEINVVHAIKQLISRRSLSTAWQQHWRLHCGNSLLASTELTMLCLSEG